MSKRQIEEYRKTHCYCEACGSNIDCEVAHIRSKGAGGTDDPDNLLYKCWQCHHNVWHSMGPRAFVRMFPHLRAKVLKMKSKLEERYILK